MFAFSGIISYVGHTGSLRRTENSVFILNGKFHCMIARGVVAAAAIF